MNYKEALEEVLAEWAKDNGYVRLSKDQAPPLINVNPILSMPVPGTDMELQFTTVEQQAEIDKLLISEEVYQENKDDNEDLLIAQHNKSVQDMLKGDSKGVWRKVILEAKE